jgi:glycosyltransferase involved in cell wall biosynthesis/GT2 family glycosyltransferase
LLGVAVLNWNNAGDTVDCLKSLATARSLTRLSVVVVDNGSTTADRDRLGDWVTGAQASGLPFRFIALPTNLGYGAGNNVAIRQLLDDGVEWVWILNNDTVVDGTDIDRLVHALDSAAVEQIGLLGLRLHRPGTDSDDDTLGGGTLTPTGARTVPLRAGDDLRAAEAEDVVDLPLDYVSGASLLARRAVFLECGLLPEDHFLFWEEMELCCRATAAGHRIGVLPAVTVRHKEGATSGVADRQRKHATAHFFAARANMLFLRKHRRRQLLPGAAARLGHAVVTAVRQRDPAAGFAVARGVVLGLTCRRERRAPRHGPARLALVCQPVDGGAAVCAAELAAVAAEAGWAVSLVSPPGALTDWTAGSGVTWHELALRRSPDLHDLRHVLALRKLLRTFDVVHLHSSKAGAVGRVALRTLGRRATGSAFTPHGWSWLVGGPLRPLYLGIERCLSRSSDVVVAVSDRDAAEGRAHAPRIPVRVIRNGIDVARFEPAGTVASRSGDPLVVVVGRLCPAKGQDLAVRALAQMADTAARLRLVGAGEDETMLKELADSLGVADRVEMLGHVEDPRPHYRAADVVLAPSRWDACSLVVLEALACGANVVASDAVGAALEFDDVVTLVRAGDTAAIAAALDRALAASARGAPGDRHLRQRLETLWSRKQFADSHLRLYDELRTLTRQRESGKSIEVLLRYTGSGGG